MGLFSAIGKVLKGVSKVAGFIPGIGGAVSKVAGTVGNLLDHKQPLSTFSTKARLATMGGGAGVVYMRGNSPNAATQGIVAANAQALRASPVLPGGAVATRSGPVAKSATPPRTYGGSRGKKKKASYTSKKRRTKARTGGKRKATRRLKFGSAAYRKKYLGHR